MKDPRQNIKAGTGVNITRPLGRRNLTSRTPNAKMRNRITARPKKP